MKYIYVIVLAVIFTACSTSGEKQSKEQSEMDHSRSHG